jgi:hypothetical protein
MLAFQRLLFITLPSWLDCLFAGSTIPSACSHPPLWQQKCCLGAVRLFASFWLNQMEAFFHGRHTVPSLHHTSAFVKGVHPMEGFLQALLVSHSSLGAAKASKHILAYNYIRRDAMTCLKFWV